MDQQKRQRSCRGGGGVISFPVLIPITASEDMARCNAWISPNGDVYKQPDDSEAITWHFEMASELCDMLKVKRIDIKSTEEDYLVENGWVKLHVPYALNYLYVVGGKKPSSDQRNAMFKEGLISRHNIDEMEMWF